MKHPNKFTINRQKRLFRTIGTIICATTLVTSQSLWLLNKPVFADKVNTNSTAICGVPGNDGDYITGTTQVNTLFPGTGSGVSQNSTSITVGTATGASTAIQPGDLLLVIQMQGADIDSSNTDAYGDGSSVNNPNQGATNYPAGGVVNGNLATNFTAGNFEYVVATNIVPTSGGIINLSTPLVNSYSNANFGTQGQRRFQIIRIPQYNNLTLSGTITAPQWNGTSGGIVAVDVAGKFTFSGGKIDVAGRGFRGGGSRVLAGDSGTPTLLNTDVVTLSTRTANASKGEGTAGTPRYLYDSAFDSLIGTTSTPEGYPSGSYGRGAPGNAGGGGTDGYPKTGTTAPSSYGNGQNAGGGGGSNGGVGGKGGYTWYTKLPYGGDGGAPFSVASASRLVLGGGAGAGTNNDSSGDGPLASSGAAGGGIVMVRAGNITGPGTIDASGATPLKKPAKDASGGGGAGGSVLVISQSGGLAGLTINANGGKGGSNTGATSTPKAHGPGGGGGGGAIFTSSNDAISSRLGGEPGTTIDDNGLTSYGGATAGDGVLGSVTTSSSDATTSISGSSCLIQATKTTSTPGPLVAGSTATYTIKVSNPVGTNRAEARQVVITDDSLPSGFTHTAVGITPQYTGGATGPATVSATGTTSKPSWSGTSPNDFKIPPGGSISITFTANIDTNTAAGKYNNSVVASAKYINSSAGVTTVSSSAIAVSSTYDGTVAANTAEDVSVVSPSTLTANKTVALVVDVDKSGGTTPLASQVATPGDILEYTVIVKNTSTTTSTSNVVLKDIIPANTTYVASTLKIDGVGKNDTSADDQAEFASSQAVFRLGTGASGTTGGTLGTTTANNTSTIKFQVKVNDPMPNGVNTVSNQAVVSSNGVGDVNSNDPTTPTALDPTVTKIGPRLRLVKRVTGVRKFGSTTTTAIGGYYDLATDVNDDTTVKWPGTSTNYLLGAITGNQIPTPSPGAPGPKDEVEYTIYFLSDGAMTAQSVNICDFIPTNQTYVPTTMQLNLSGTMSAIADTPPSAGASGFYTTSFPTACTGTNNSTGAAYFQVGNVNSANNTPATSYGFIRFRAKVK